MHECPADKDQFTTYVNELWNIAMDALSYLSDRAKLSKIIQEWHVATPSIVLDDQVSKLTGN